MVTKAEIPIAEHDAESSDSPVAQAQERQNDVSLLDILIILARRKRTILKATIVCCIAGLLFSLVWPKQYTAVSTVLPPKQNSSSLASMLTSELGDLGGLAALAGGGGQSLLKNPNDLYVAMLKSQTVEDAMIQRFGLMREYKKKYLSDTRKKFENNFLVDTSAKDGLLHISVKDQDPKRAADMANGWIDQFRKLSQTLAITEASQRRVFFEAQLRQSENNLSNAEEVLKQTEQKSGMIQPDSQARALIASAASLQGEITAREVQLQAMRTYATDENSNVIQIQQELDGLRSQLAKLGSSEDDASAGLVLPKGQIPQAGLEYARKLRDVKYYETIFEILARQFELAKLDEAKEGALIQVVDPALPPDKRSSPIRWLVTLVAALGGLFFGAFGVLAQAGLEYRRQDPETREKLDFLRKAMGSKTLHPS